MHRLNFLIAIVLTACGIETAQKAMENAKKIFMAIAIVLTACGIETYLSIQYGLSNGLIIAIVLTACGIETPFRTA